MDTAKQARPYLNPYLAGTLLGVVLFLSFYATGGGLGASGALTTSRPACSTGSPRPTSTAPPTSPTWPAAASNPWDNAGVYMLVGTLLGGFVSGLFNRRVKLELRKGPHISAR